MLKVTEKKKHFKGYLSRLHSKVIYQTAEVATWVQNLTRIVYLLIYFCRYVIDSLHWPILNWTPEWEFVSINQFLTSHNQGI